MKRLYVHVHIIGKMPRRPVYRRDPLRLSRMPTFRETYSLQLSGVYVCPHHHRTQQAAMSCSWRPEG